MHLLDILKPEAIIPDLAARHKKEVLDELCRKVASIEGVDKEPLLEVLLEREKLGSTGMEDGVAIPHGKTETIDKMLMVCGRSKTGVDFDSIDGKPTHIFFLLIAPGESSGIHLKALAKISRLAKNEGFRQELMALEGSNQIYDLIARKDTAF